MTIFSGHGCNAPRTISTRRSTASHATRPRYGRTNDNIHGTRCFWSSGAAGVIGLTSAGPPSGKGGERPWNEPCLCGQPRNIHRHNAVVARIGHVEVPPARIECHARRRAKHLSTLVAHVTHE